MTRIPDQDLLDDLRRRATFLGHRPTYKDVGMPWTKYSRRTFEMRFGTITKAIEAAGLESLTPAPTNDWVRRRKS